MADSAIDAVAPLDGSSPTVFYGATEIAPNTANFPFDLIFRTVDGVGDTSADWMTQDHFDLEIEFGDENDLLSTPGATNTRSASAYAVTIDDCSAPDGQFVINFTATGSSDVYVSTDLIDFVLATNGGGVASGIYTDTAPPGDRAFYLIQEAGTAAP